MAATVGILGSKASGWSGCMKMTMSKCFGSDLSMRDCLLLLLLCSKEKEKAG